MLFRSVPYKALQLAVQDVIAGQVPSSFSTTGEAIAHVKAGKLKVIAVVGSQRFAPWPEAATVTETLPEFEPPPLWVGLFGPGNLARPLVQRIRDDIAKTYTDATVREKINAMGTRPVGNTPEEFVAVMKRQGAALGRVVKAAGIQPID